MVKALVLHSGGLDSTLCLLMARKAGREVLSLGVDYGQSHRIELEYALGQCRKYDIERRVLRVEWDKPVRDIPTDRSLDEMRSSVSPAFLPGRNAVFLTLACAQAAGIECEEVWIGVNAVDYSGYPDCRPEFIDSFGVMIEVAIPGGAKIVTPLMEMSKAQIAAKAHELGLLPGDTWSCYKPRITAQGILPCNECDACILHDHAWREAGGNKGTN
jgi:7-cyano-7-deazaguanine synthase